MLGAGARARRRRDSGRGADAPVLVNEEVAVGVVQRRVEHLAEVARGVLPHGHLHAEDDLTLDLEDLARRGEFARDVLSTTEAWRSSTVRLLGVVRRTKESRPVVDELVDRLANVVEGAVGRLLLGERRHDPRVASASPAP